MQRHSKINSQAKSPQLRARLEGQGETSLAHLLPTKAPEGTYQIFL